jgi:multiple sugar transport system ATP-binding protein
MNFATVTIAAGLAPLWTHNEGIHIKLRAEVMGRLRTHVGGNVTIGIRPEDLRVTSSSHPADLAFDAVVGSLRSSGRRFSWT